MKQRRKRSDQEERRRGNEGVHLKEEETNADKPVCLQRTKRKIISGVKCDLMTIRRGK